MENTFEQTMIAKTIRKMKAMPIKRKKNTELAANDYLTLKS